MGTIWKMVLTLAIILLIAATGTTITSANVDIAVAQNYMEEVAAVLKESNYSEKIISQCQQEAIENGYELEVQVYRNEAYINSSYAIVSLYYQYRLPLLQVAQQKKMEQII